MCTQSWLAAWVRTLSAERRALRAGCAPSPRYRRRSLGFAGGGDERLFFGVDACRSTLTPLAREPDPRLALTSREDGGRYCDERAGEDRLLLGHIRLRPAVRRRPFRERPTDPIEGSVAQVCSAQTGRKDRRRTHPRTNTRCSLLGRDMGRRSLQPRLLDPRKHAPNEPQIEFSKDAIGRCERPIRPTRHHGLR